MRVAVIGSGVSGLGCSWALAQAGISVTLYEKDPRLGGHTNTIDIPGVGPVDTGFIVFNPNTYPNLINLLSHLRVKFINSDMSFAVTADGGRFEWAGEGLHTVFAQKSNLLSPSFYRMIWDILRFNREAVRFLEEAEGPRADPKKAVMSLGEYLDLHGYSQAFRDGYLLPMTAAIWSTPVSEMLQFPALTLIRFCHNHSLLQIEGRPTWLTVSNGSREYVRVIEKLLKDVRVATPVASVNRNADGTVTVNDAHGTSEVFDHVVFACHGDQTLKLLADPTPLERQVLGRVSYKGNRAIVHRDAKFMPLRKSTWSSWNYQSLSNNRKAASVVSLTYWMNRLQPFLPKDDNIFVTLNPLFEPKRELLIAEYHYEHPIYNVQTILSQKELPLIQGKANTWFAGAWTNYGFHEDGLTSGLKVAAAIGAKIPFPVIDSTHIRPLKSKL